jgi:hypothetical protein
MSMTQTLIGGGVIAALAQVIWVSLAPAPPPIVVHDLRYDAGFIVQDRTVEGPAVVAQWRADILNLDGSAVKNCHGEGFWRYAGGRAQPRFTVQEWVGNPLCDLPPGRYIPRAIYSNGSFELVKRGEIFEVME